MFEAMILFSVRVLYIWFSNLLIFLNLFLSTSTLSFDVICLFYLFPSWLHIIELWMWPHVFFLWSRHHVSLRLRLISWPFSNTDADAGFQLQFCWPSPLSPWRNVCQRNLWSEREGLAQLCLRRSYCIQQVRLGRHLHGLASVGAGAPLAL